MMKKILNYLLVFSAFFAVSCGDLFGDDNHTERLPAEQTTLIYFVGTDLSYFFDKNLADAKEAIAKGVLGQRGRFLFYISDYTNKASLSEYVYNSATGLVDSIAIKNYSSFDETEAEALTQVLQDTRSSIGEQSELNMVVSGHGWGWIPESFVQTSFSASADPKDYEQRVNGQNGYYVTRYMGASTDGYMEISDLEEGIRQSGEKLGYMLFDMCFMGNVELHYRLRNVTDYIISSPAEVMGDGFPYKVILPYMFANGGQSFDLNGICSSFYNFYQNDFSTIGTRQSATVSLCKTSQLDELADEMRKLTFRDLSSTELDSVQQYEGLNNNLYKDLGDYVQTASRDNLNDFFAAFDAAYPPAQRLHTDEFFANVNDSFYSMIPIDDAGYFGVSTSTLSQSHYYRLTSKSYNYCEDVQTEWKKEPWYEAAYQQ